MHETPHAPIATRALPELRPVILHAVREYLPLTENWIYAQIRHATGCFPVVVCDRRCPGGDFPLPDVFANDALPFAAVHDWISKVHRRLAYANWPGSYAEVARRYRPQLIHAHFGDRGVLMLGLAKRLGVPLVTTFYGYDVSTLPRRREWKPRLARLFDEGTLFLAEGPYMRDRLIALGCPPEKAFVQHLGVSLADLPFRERRPDGGPVRLLMAASFREKKGLRYGLEAFARLAARRKGQLQLTIIGDGPLAGELRQLAMDWRVMPFIRWLGYQPREVFFREALDAHLFIQPSVVAADGDSEGGAPVALIEAQATGMPVLATTHADIPEVTLPGESAFLVGERDVDALEERLAFLLDHPERWPAMGRAGRRHVEAAFDCVAQGQQLEAHYRRLLGS